MKLVANKTKVAHFFISAKLSATDSCLYYLKNLFQESTFMTLLVRSITAQQVSLSAYLVHLINPVLTRNTD